MRNTRAGVLISSGRGRTVVESASHSRTNFIFVVILALLHPSEGPGFGRTQKSFSTPTEHMMRNGDDHLAVVLFLIIVVVLLVIILGLVEFLERHDFRHDGIVKILLRLHL